MMKGLVIHAPPVHPRLLRERPGSNLDQSLGVQGHHQSASDNAPEIGDSRSKGSVRCPWEYPLPSALHHAMQGYLPDGSFWRPKAASNERRVRVNSSTPATW